MSHRKFTDEQEAEMAGLYREGLSYPKLAYLYNTSALVIRWAMKRQGVTPRHCGAYPILEIYKDKVDIIYQRYSRGDTQSAIARDLGLHQSTVGGITLKLGLSKPCRQNRNGHGNWKGGKNKTTYGYIEVLLEKDSPYFSMANSGGYVLEHRLVMAQRLGRPLTKSESVHHINGIKDDNADKNLELRMGKHGNGITFVCADCGSRNIKYAEFE